MIARQTVSVGEVDDALLVTQVRNGDREAFSGLVRRHQEVLYRHALGMVGDGDVAADLVQESLVRGFTRLSQCEDPARFGSWQFRILRNACLDYLKNRRRKNIPLTSAGPLVSERNDPVSDLVLSETRSSISKALGSLSESQREAFLLKHVEDLSYEEMAEITGQGVSALKMRVKRAREELQVLLSKQQRGAEL